MATSLGITTVVEPQVPLAELPLFERALDEGVLSSRVIAALFHPVGADAAFRAQLRDAVDSAPARDRAAPRAGQALRRRRDRAAHGADARGLREPARAARPAELRRRGARRGDPRARPARLPDPHARDGRRRHPARARRDRGRGPRERNPRPSARDRARRVPAPRRPRRGSASSASRRRCSPGTARPTSSPAPGWRTWARSAGIAPGGSAACSTRARRSRSRATGRSARWIRSSGSTRRRPAPASTGRMPGPPRERVGLDRSLEAYTVHGARAWHAEGSLGRIAPGMLADLAVWSTDLYEPRARSRRAPRRARRAHVRRRRDRVLGGRPRRSRRRRGAARPRRGAGRAGRRARARALSVPPVE